MFPAALFCFRKGMGCFPFFPIPVSFSSLTVFLLASDAVRGRRGRFFHLLSFPPYRSIEYEDLLNLSQRPLEVTSPPLARFLFLIRRALRLASVSLLRCWRSQVSPPPSLLVMSFGQKLSVLGPPACTGVRFLILAFQVLHEASVFSKTAGSPFPVTTNPLPPPEATGTFAFPPLNCPR